MSESFSKKDSMCMKGIAILIMMFHHCYRSKDRFEKYIVDFWPFDMDLVVNVSDYLKICVSIFAFITGYGLYLSARNRCVDAGSTERWIYERLVKTLSGFWFIYVLVFAVTQIYAGYPAQIYFGQGKLRGVVYALIDFLGLANLLECPTLVSTWWYMSAAIVFIVLYPLFVKWTQKLGYTTLFMVVAFLPRSVSGNVYPGGITAITFVFPVLLGMLFAQYDVFGKLCAFKLSRNKWLDFWMQFLLYHAVLVGSVVLWVRFPRNVVWEYHTGLAPLIFICYSRKYLVRMPGAQKFLFFCGKHSMNVFLVHSFIRYVFFEEFTYSFKYFGLIVVVLFTISLGISILIELLKKWTNYNGAVNFICAKIRG